MQHAALRRTPAAAALLVAVITFAALAGACNARHLAQGPFSRGPSRRVPRQLLAAHGTPKTDTRGPNKAKLAAPVAERRAHPMTLHNDTRQDDYYWLRDDARKDADIIDYLSRENNYTAALMADTKGLQARLFKEMRSRMRDDDSSVPTRYKGYWYYARIADGQQYYVHCRRAVPPGAPPLLETDGPDFGSPEEVLLDENARKAEGGHDFYMLNGVVTSPDQKLLAWSEDTEGGEKYTVHVKDIASGKELITPIPETTGAMVWANDNATLFYILSDDVNRAYKIMRHTIGQDSPNDTLVYEESDPQFTAGVSRDASGKLIYVAAGSSLTSEVWYLDADNPTGELKVVLPRKHNVDYDVSFHAGDKPGSDWFLIVLRDEAHPNSELRTAPVSNPQNQTVVLAHRDKVQIEGASLTKKYLLVNERANASTRMVVHRLHARGAMPSKPLGPGEAITFDEPVYTLSGGITGDFDSDVMRLYYESMTTPDSVVDHHIPSGRRIVKQVHNPEGSFNKDDYKSERVWATAPDGTQVPISLVYRKALFKRDGSAPMLLHGYGSYGYSYDPSFVPSELSLLDRGWIAAIAHIRGGGDMGRLWYEDGKFLKKTNTFTDFIAAAEHLVKAGYTSPDRLTIEGRSAGGMLIGATINRRPDLFKAAIAGVPFVDCLTTMLDESIPLTTVEFEEWGNPMDPTYYKYMKGYSPVDNVAAQSYPNLLVTAGLNDPRVGYWEPAKFVAKLRAAKTDDNLLLLKTDMGAGHFSVTGRFERIKEKAIEFAFLLKATGQDGMKPLEGTGTGLKKGAAKKTAKAIEAEEEVDAME